MNWRETSSGWTDEEIAIIRKYWTTEGPALLVHRLPGRTRNSIIGKGHRLFLGPTVGAQPHQAPKVRTEPLAVPPVVPDAPMTAVKRSTPKYAPSQSVHRYVPRPISPPPPPRKQTRLAVDLVRRPVARIVLGENVTAEHMGDPPPGRSALAQRR